MSLDTDLPDNTIVMVSVSRSYWEAGSPDEYSVDYFSEKRMVGAWRSRREIRVDDTSWNSALRAKQKEMAKLGLALTLHPLVTTSISGWWFQSVKPTADSGPGMSIL